MGCCMDTPTGGDWTPVSRKGRRASRRVVLSSILIGATLSVSGWPRAVADDPCVGARERWTRASPTTAHQRQLDPPAISFDLSPEEAARPEVLACLIEVGRQLFDARFTPADGAGRPGATGNSKPTVRPTANDPGFSRTSGLDANSCGGCHNQPAIGGSGDFVANVFVGAQFRDPPTKSIAVLETSERNTLSVFGAGAIELIAREMTAELWQIRDAALLTAATTSHDVRVPLRAKDVAFGYVTARTDGSYDGSEVSGVDVDLVVKPFGVKGVVISLREFSINALNHHHGVEAVERFGWERTGRRDFDLDGIPDEMSLGQVTALTIFQAALPPPGLRPEYGMSADSIARGRQLFERVGCADCHRPSLPLNSPVFVEPNPYNRPGNVLPADLPSATVEVPLPVGAEGAGVFRTADGRVRVAAFTDLKRHRICDADDRHFCNEQLRQDNVPVDQFLTSKLWDAGTSASPGIVAIARLWRRRSITIPARRANPVVASRGSLCPNSETSSSFCAHFAHRTRMGHTETADTRPWVVQRGKTCGDESRVDLYPLWPSP